MTQPNLLKRLGLDKDSQGGLAKYYVLETLLTYYDTTYSIGENPKAVSNPDGTAYYLDQSLGHAVTLHDSCGGGQSQKVSDLECGLEVSASPNSCGDRTFTFKNVSSGSYPIVSYVMESTRPELPQLDYINSTDSGITVMPNHQTPQELCGDENKNYQRLVATDSQGCSVTAIYALGRHSGEFPGGQGCKFASLGQSPAVSVNAWNITSDNPVGLATFIFGTRFLADNTRRLHAASNFGLCVSGVKSTSEMLGLFDSMVLELVDNATQNVVASISGPENLGAHVCFGVVPSGAYFARLSATALGVTESLQTAVFNWVA